MKKLNKSLKRMEGNKGFTLVELIIVIAIIAILAAVLAPQYVKYLEKSRIGTDANAMGEIAHAAEVASIGDGTTAPTATTMTVSISSAGVATYDSGDLATAVADIAPASAYAFKSNLYKGCTSVTITIANGVASWTAPTAAAAAGTT